MEIVDVVASIVSRYPSLAEPLLQLLVVIEAVVDGAPGGGFCEVESQVEGAADRLVCDALGLVLGRLQPESEVVEVGGVQYRRMKEASRGEYFARRGRVEVERHLYRQVGVHNGPTIVPLELQTGLVHGRWTPLAAVAAAHLLQDEPSRDAVATCEALGVMPYSRSSLARTGEEIGSRWEEFRWLGEDHLVNSLAIPDDATVISLSADRVSLPMVELRRDEHGNVLEDDKGQPLIEVNFRMAFCGVWSLHDAEGEPLLTTRYGRMPHEGHAPIEESLRGDLEAVLLERPDLTCVGVADGAPEMQLLLTRVFQGAGRPDAPVSVDFWHLVEKLSGAVRSTGREPKEHLPEFRRTLKEEDAGVERVEMRLRTWRLDYSDDEVPEDLAAALTYIDNNRDRMRYRPLIEAGLPIGSGGVEATCKTLVSTRMKRSGASWKTPGGQAVLSLRSLARSSRWSAAMEFLLATYVTPVREVEGRRSA